MNPELKQIAAEQGGVVSSRQAADTGYTREQIRERLGDGRWERVRYGQYAERLDLTGLAPWDRHVVRHRQLVHAAMNSMRRGSAVVSHHSALVMYGVPVWRADLTEVQLTRTTGRSGLLAGVRHHRGLLETSDVTQIEGLATTSLARAVVESAARTSFEAAVVSADAALRHYDLNPRDLQRLRATTECWPGGPTIRSVLAFADPLAESVGESRLRVLMRNQGLPSPDLQVEFADDGGFIGRVDFFFPDHDTVVEFDGMVKYADESRDALIREKAREDRLRALGLEIVRTTWSDLAHPHRTAMRIRSGFARSRRTVLTG
ncbi:type IV toxin-antitoxin system AbiEi family antitoxin domain-containing protein [Kribbella pittospori]|uniref:type IV toxin-antitoxin system AbiEi family antitoxin domain-containing protein n=1 Tax=Kribbella pittospori TaxID=722689 RepID=UPI0013F46606|nr:type IV toxin-antitoxin system AbiEi family antitoxin domain-containing protein [Kribbella pittospori]